MKTKILSVLLLLAALVTHADNILVRVHNTTDETNYLFMPIFDRTGGPNGTFDSITGEYQTGNRQVVNGELITEPMIFAIAPGHTTTLDVPNNYYWVGPVPEDGQGELLYLAPDTDVPSLPSLNLELAEDENEVYSVAMTRVALLPGVSDEAPQNPSEVVGSDSWWDAKLGVMEMAFGLVAALIVTIAMMFILRGWMPLASRR